MAGASTWPNAGRAVWLTGGIVAYNNPGPHVEICTGSGGRSIYGFKLGSYGSLFEELKRQEVAIIGATFVVQNDELAGLRPAEFRAAGSLSGWSLWDVRKQWREISFAANKGNNMPLLDVSARLASGLEYSQSRLYDLVSAYAVQLGARSKKNDIVDYGRFKDLFSREVYKAIHALFWELAVLRDTMAEFVATFCLNRNGIRSLSGLLRDLKKAPSADPIAKELLTISDGAGGGWLFRFTSFRNFFTHVAPMELAGGNAFTVQDVRRIKGQIQLPQIYYPLPGNIEDLARERSRVGFYPTVAALVEASQRRPIRAEDPDALEYLHASLDRFVELAKSLVARSPLPPSPIHLTAEDIIGEIKWTPGSSN
jgi:hypothetical protein